MPFDIILNLYLMSAFIGFIFYLLSETQLAGVCTSIWLRAQLTMSAAH